MLDRIRRRWVLPALVVTVVATVTVVGADVVGASAQTVLDEQVAEDFELVGHHPLFNRGMNAAIAVHGDHVYVGNRTDGSPQHQHPGVLIVDVSDPSSPEIAGEIGPPREGNVGMTSRELRVWPQQDLLMVLNFGCSSAIHACSGGETQGSNVKFYDIAGDKATQPELVGTYQPTETPHEFFLWVDPNRPETRALLFQSTPTTGADEDEPNLIVADISKAREDEFSEVATWVATFPPEETDRGNTEDRRLHSLGVSNDGRRAHLAFLGAGYFVLDTSEVIEGIEDPEMRLITPPGDNPAWTNPGAHSAVKVPGRDVALVTDEVYGDALDALGPHGCPWGWVRTIDIADPAAAEVVGQFKAEQNTTDYCDSTQGQDPSNTCCTSYSAHNPTVLPNIAFVTWHSSGMIAIDISDPISPEKTGLFDPQPLEFVSQEDPVLNTGRDKTTMWTYPIIKDGLIYAADIRNGLYILRYTGPHADTVDTVDFLEGNSNLGDALRFEPAGSPPTSSRTPAGDAGADTSDQTPVTDEARVAVETESLPATGTGGGLLAVSALGLAALMRRRHRPEG